MSKRSRVLKLTLSIVALGTITVAGFSTRWSSVFATFSPGEPTSPASQPGSGASAPLAIGTCDTAGPIEVESTGGTTAPTAYGTLKLAFDAIIAGTHTGSISIEVCGNTTETATAALTASGIGSASYSSIMIRPVGAGRIIEGSIVGAIIKLNGADNVTIDGRQGGTGTSRDLTVRNNNTSTATAAIWLASVAAGNGASNNTVRNLEIVAGQTANTGTNTTIDVYMGGTTISLTATDGNDNDNNQFIFNRFTRARYGLATRGVTTNNNEGLVITDNTFGPNSFGVDEIGKAAIFLQSDTGAVVSRNTIQFVGGDLANTTAGADRCGICIGGENWSVTDSTTITSGDYTVTKNIIHDIVEERTFSAIGIKLGTTRSGSPTNNLVANNFVYNVRADSTSGDQAVGIGYANGNTDKIVNNSISITGDQDPGASALSTTYGNAIRITQANGTNNANLTLMNNSIYVDASSSTAANHYYAITLNSNAYAFGTGGLNYNNYYINGANTQLRTGGLVTTGTGSAATTEFQTLVNWQAALTTPQDANSKQTDPLYISPTNDLHIGALSPNVDMGTPVTGITDDIDGQARPNGSAFDIGADEFFPSPGMVQLSSGTYSVTEAAGTVTITVTRTAGSSGAVSVNYATSDGTATGGGSCGGSVDYVSASGTLNWADNDTASKTFNVTVCNDGVDESSETVNIALTNPTGGVTIGTPNTAVLTIVNSVVFTGSVNVGTGQTFTSLTNPGGIFEALNNGTVAANTTINITSDLTSETGAVFLNQLIESGAGGYIVTFKPSGGARVISGTNNSGALIRLNGADRITIDGSTSGGTDRSLTITNNSTATSTAAIHISSLGAGAGATDNTIKNTNLSCGADQSTSVNVTYGISHGGALLGNSGADNDNNSFINNAITKVNVGIYSSGESAANQVQNTVISNNLIGPAAFGSDQIGRAGIIFNLTNNAQVTGNEVRFVGVLDPQTSTGGSYDKFGISHAFNGWSDTTFGDLAVSNTTIARNKVHDIVEENTFSAVGIFMAGGNGANDTLNTTVNNFIWNVRANGTLGDNGVSLGIASGKGDTVAFNSIYMAGDLDPGVAATSSQSSFAIQITSTTVVNLNLKDNISFADMTSNTATLKHGSIKIPASFVWGTGGSNFNDLYVPAANAQAIIGRVNATDAATLADWQTATTQDANSKSVDPLFVSATDLHLQAASTLVDMGTAIAGVTTDIDGDPRGASPDIGADEIVANADLGITKSDGLTTAVPGAPVTYTITASNAGPAAATGATVTDTFPGILTANWTCSGAGGGTCTASGSGNISDTVNLPSGGSVTYTVSGMISAAATGSLSNTASVAPPSGTVDPTPGNNSATDTDTLGAQADLSITKTDGVTTVNAGGMTTYTIVASNAGPSNAVGASVMDSFPATITAASWTCVGAGGATCAAAGSGNITDTVNLPSGGSVTYTAMASISGSASGNLSNTATVTAPGGVVDPTPGNNSASDTDTISTSTGPVTVTATAGTPGPTDYATLKAAIDAINAGTHQGDITVSIVTSTTEPATSVLNAGTGAAPAAYTSVLIRPISDGVTIAGPSVQGRGLLELNGADNVTIDGDNPNTAGTNRNLTIQNTAANTVTFASVIRIALNTTTVTSGDNDIFRNLNILGNATGRNIGAANTTTGTENNSFAILLGLGASAPTTAPAAIASVSTGIAAPGTATNLQITNNNVRTAGRAISINGTSTTVASGLVISNNSVGNPVAGDPDQVTAIGITAQGSTNAIISGNTVWVEGFVPSSAAGQGINVGVNSTNITGATIENNKINRVQNNNTTTWSAMGINLGGGNSHIVQNNFVSGVINDQTAGTGAFGTTFGAYGIRVASGTGHKVYHNSVHLYGPMPGVTSTNLTAAFMIVATSQTGMDVRNNIFSNQIAGGNPTGTRNVAVFLPSAGTSAMNLTWNNNGYYAGSDALNRLAQVGATFGTGEYQVSDFDPTATTPATNLRAYTSTLSAAGTNDNASFAQSSPPPFVSNSDLHIPAGTATRLESGGAAVGVTLDIDGAPRSATTPDIGADEFAGLPPAANDIAATGFVNPANGATISTGATFTPQAKFTNNGTATQTSVTVRFKIIDATMAVIYNQTATIPTIAPLQSVTVSFPSTSIVSAGNYTMQASAELAGDSVPGNDSISGSFTAVAPIGGTVTVGAAGDYTSLTNPGGLFQALNTAGISGNLTVNITSDLTTETGAVALNQLTEAGAGGYTVTIKPSGAARTISGTSAASSGLIILNGADRIVFDGSLSGGTDRSLTITNNQATTGIVIWIRSPNATNGATNNTVKNCILNGAPGPNSTTVAGVLTGSSVTLGGDAEAPNSNNTIQNNWIYRVQNSLYLRGGTVSANFDQNWTVVGNELGSTVANDKNIFRGMLIGNSANFTISGNTVHGIQSTTATAAAMSGIQLGLLLSNGMVNNNQISDIKNISASGTGAHGISIIATSTSSNVTIANNFISDIATLGSATVASNGHGIAFLSLAPGGSGYNLYFNSVNLNTNQGSAQTSAAMFITSTFNVAGAINARNNIFADTEVTGSRFGVYSLAPANVFAAIDYNDYFAQNVGFIGGSARVTLSDWQTATGGDVNSKAVDPLFVSPTNLHLQATSTLLGMGVSGTGITTDIDGQTRDTPPDIGADEVLAAVTPGSVQFGQPTYTVGEGGGSVVISVTRTGGSAGAISVNYATANGTATGGASCTAGIDFANASGTLNWADGDSAAKTFSVTICDDALVEGSENFTGGLSSPTGGATIGSPSTTTVTITDNDVPPPGTFTINDVRVLEGNTGGANAVFTVTYVGAAPASVNFATANGTAIAGLDYLSVNGTLNFASSGSQPVTVPIVGKGLKEENETFFVNLSSPVNATILDSQGVGIIIDEDRAYVADFDRDYFSDLSVFRPSEGAWYILRSSSVTPSIVNFGLAGDRPVPGDYDGDGKTDVAVYRQTEGKWYIMSSLSGTTQTVNWGTASDKPVQGDYDGDGKTDIAIFRPFTGQWWILRSSDGASATVSFGISSDKLVQGDYDGDFKTDEAVYRDGTWYILLSSNGSVVTQNFGLASDRPVPADFDGDGKYDLAIFRNGDWWVIDSLTGTVGVLHWGQAGDIPTPADYDRDGTTDFSIFRPSTGEWYVLRSSDNSYFSLQWGINGDIPIPSAYLPQ